MHDTFGGVGITCLDFSTTNTKFLAACTLKSNMLEIWDTQMNQLYKIIPIGLRSVFIQWAPTNTKHIAILSESLTIKIVNIETGTSDNLPLTDVTTIKWHPRQPSKLLIGSNKGNIYLYNIEKKAIEINY